MPLHVLFVWTPHQVLPNGLYHVLNSFISKLLYMETVCNPTCGRKAYTYRLFHIGSHIKCYFPYLETLRLGSFRRMDLTVFTSVPFMMAIILQAPPLFSLFINMVYNSPRERHTSSISTYAPMFFSNSTHSSACGSWFHSKYSLRWLRYWLSRSSPSIPNRVPKSLQLTGSVSI